MMDADPEKTLEQIENVYWGEPTYDSYLVTTCQQLRKKPLQDFTIEDLRIMIGQNISLNILMPMAIERLKQNILAEGHFYPGDLLYVVLTAEASFWVDNPELHQNLTRLYRNNLPSLEKRAGRSFNRDSFKSISESFEVFNKIHG